MVGKGSKLTMLPRGSRKLSARLVASAFKKRCSPNTSPEVIQRAYWNPSLEKSLVDILHEYKDSGFRGDNGWSSEGWNKMVKVFHERNKYVSFSKGQIQEKTGQLKRDYQMLKEAKKQSGCHWNENRCMIEGGPALWENLIVKFPKIKKFRNAKATFPLFDALGALYDEGTYNVTSLGDEEPLQQIHDLEDEEQLRQTHYVEDEESLRQIHDLEDEEQLRQTHYVEDEESLRQIHDLEDEETQEDRAEEHMDEEHRTAHQKRVAAIPRHNEENEPKRARTSKIVSMMEKYCEMKTKHAKDEAAREKEITREKLIAGGKECAQCPDFSIMRCILVLDTMEVTKVEKARAYTVFKTPENREIFLSACSKDPEAAMIWLRSEMEAVKVMAAGT